MRWRIAALGFLIASAAGAQPAIVNEWSADEALLRDRGLPTKGAELLQILRDRTPAASTIDHFKKQVGRLKAAGYVERVKGTSELTKLGPAVRPLLEALLLDIKADAETVGRLRQVLEQFPAERELAAMAAATRLIARDRPPGSLPVLLDFVPFATHESVRQEVQHAIDAMALVDKRPAPLLVETLKDANPARRAAAAEALVRAIGITGAKDKLEPLMRDSHPQVRYQLGLALVEKHDKRGVPLLIQTLADAPPDRADCALELLYRAAGENTPTVYYHGKHTGAACSAAWQKWDDAHHAKLDLAKQLSQKEIGLTVITTSALKPNTTNKIFEIGPTPENAVRWEFVGPRYPLDLQILGPDRILVAEYFDRRVTERDFKGNILKTFPANMPIGCQRFPNGDTFIVTRQQLVLVDRDGNDLFSHPSPDGGTISAAQRLRNGQMAVVTTGGRCQLLDAQGRELKGFPLCGMVYTLGGNIEVLPNGRILTPLYNLNTVTEFDWAGNKLWQASVNRPVSVSRLANGHTLVTCSIDYRVIELDQQGKEVWSYHTDGRPFRARRR